ncbi:MAG: ParB N-terminal domain-containing protein, partial [Rectinemataceae bacterium]|nr:ParB N-terminal domain-containing protein [Rectinemataceae bacterium]
MLCSFIMAEALQIEDLAISAIGTRYAELRIVKPIADRLLEKSLRQYGQMLPVVCVRFGAGYELIDGFKRLRANVRLGRTTLLARIMDAMPERACKTAVV